MLDASDVAPFRDDIDFAVIAVRLGWSLAEYEAITPVQKRFILKEIERATVSDSELSRSAVELAVGNAFRKKGKRPLRLWQKRAGEPQEPPVSEDEMRALAEAFAARASARSAQPNN